MLKVAKNKEGTRGRIYLVFDGQYQRFRESALEEPAPAAKRQTCKRLPKGQLDFFDLPDEPVPFEEKTEESP